MPLFDRPIAAFDIETIPDPDIGRQVQGLKGDDETVVHAMVEARLKETDGASGYPQLPYHRVVTIGCAWLDPKSGRFKLGILGEAAMNERSHLEGFFNLFCRQPEPRLVSWNGSGFDVPVIRYRAIKHGIEAPEFYRMEGEWKWSNYQNRYHDMHVDLMDILSGFRASPFAGLGRMNSLLEIPGKRFLDKDIYDHILQGEESIVEEYCKLDCLDTLLVFLAWGVHFGALQKQRLQEWVETIRGALHEEEHALWQELAAELVGWPRWE